MNRVKRFLAIGLLSIGSIWANKSPNVLFIAVDDMKPLIKSFGSVEVETPNIDRIGSMGTSFLNAQCQFPVCGPSRASIMTGLTPETTGVLDLKTRMRDITPDILTIPQHFRNHGYTTAGVGKIYDPRCVEGRQMDDPQSWSLPFAGVPHSDDDPEKGSEKLPAIMSVDAPDDNFSDVRIRMKGIELMNQLASEEKPFFLAVGFKKPHLPFVAPKRYFDKYPVSGIEVHPFQEKAEGNSGFGYWDSKEMRGYGGTPEKGKFPETLQKELIQGYQACVNYVDDQVGLLLDNLNRLGLAENTIIVFWGDHGFHLGDHGLWGKHTAFEQAARVPLLIASPSQAIKGELSKSPAAFLDVFPTLCDLANLPKPDHLQGKSLVPVLNDPKSSVRKGAITIYKSKGAYGYSYRTDRYRYIEWIGIKSSKVVGRDLFDYQTDPMEKKSLAGNPEYEELVAKLSHDLHHEEKGWVVLENSKK